MNINNGKSQSNLLDWNWRPSPSYFAAAKQQLSAISEAEWWQRPSARRLFRPSCATCRTT